MAVSNAPWDGSAARFTPQEWKRSCLIDTGEGDPDSKSRYSLPVKTPDGALSRAGVHAAAARLNQVDAPAAKKKAAAKKLLGYYRQLQEDAPPSLKQMAS
jgi:hypothetical protein